MNPQITNQNQEEDLIILNNDSGMSFDISPKLVEDEVKVDGDIISFDDFDSNEKSKNEISFEIKDKKEDKIDFSLDLWDNSKKSEENILEIDNSSLKDDNWFDLFSETDKTGEESEGGYKDFNLESKKQEENNLVWVWENSLNSNEETINVWNEKDVLGDNFNRASILNEAIKKLEIRKQKVSDFKKTKSISMQSLLQEIERLKKEVKNLEDEIKDLDAETVSIDSDIDSIRTLLEMQDSKIKRKHDSNKLKS